MSILKGFSEKWKVASRKRILRNKEERGREEKETHSLQIKALSVMRL